MIEAEFNLLARLVNAVERIAFEIESSNKENNPKKPHELPKENE